MYNKIAQSNLEIGQYFATLPGSKHTQLSCTLTMCTMITVVLAHMTVFDFFNLRFTSKTFAFCFYICSSSTVKLLQTFGFTTSSFSHSLVDDYSSHSNLRMKIQDFSSNSNSCCLLYFNANFMCSFTKKLQLIGDFVPQTPTVALPLDPAGGLPSPRPSVFFYVLPPIIL